MGGDSGRTTKSFATPNGATITGALEAVPAVVGVGEGVGAEIITAAAGALPPVDIPLSFSMARKGDGKDHAPKVGKARPTDQPVPAGTNLKVEVPNKTRSSQLLPGEGEVGTYKALSDSGNKGDNVTPDHIPSAAFMSKFGKKKADGICMKTEHYHPGEGGRHRVSRTYGNT